MRLAIRVSEVELGDLLGFNAAVTEASAEVLVVGPGPSGLRAAVELAHHGVQARVVAREPEPHRQARASALQPGTLEILSQAGMLEPTLAASVHWDSRGCSTGALNP